MPLTLQTYFTELQERAERLAALERIQRQRDFEEDIMKVLVMIFQVSINIIGYHIVFYLYSGENLSKMVLV
jgi:predicted transcriptional regulator